jgi:oxygen-dependent protoporphyrinogen oxidase
MQVVIIGAGISGLTTAFTLQQRARQEGIALHLTLLEKEARTGGKIRSLQEEGYLCEWGPNGFLDGKPATLELCRRLQIAERLLRSDDNARKRFIYSRGRLHRVPENAAAFLRSGLISWPGKIRMAAEIIVPPYREDADETLAAFCRRRLGEEALEKLIGPMVSGIFAGDPETMSLKSCFPRIHQLEAEYGGLFRAMIRLAGKQRAARRSGQAVGSAAGPAGVLTSFAGGLQGLTDRLQQVLGDALCIANGVASLRPRRGGFELQLDDGRKIDAELVIAAIPAFALAELVAGFEPAMADLLRGIPYAPVQVSCFGYPQESFDRPLDGFGYLVARREKMDVLGTLWDSSIFAHRAPAGRVLLRSMLGGATRVEAADWDEAEVRDRTMAALKKTMGVSVPPEFVRVFAHPRAIPQYLAGHGRRVEALQERAGRYPGLFFTGNAFYGIGLNDCVSASETVAEQAWAALRARGEKA